MNQKTTNEFIQESYRRGFKDGLAAARRDEVYKEGRKDGVAERLKERRDFIDRKGAAGFF